MGARHSQTRKRFERIELSTSARDDGWTFKDDLYRDGFRVDLSPPDGEDKCEDCFCLCSDPLPKSRENSGSEQILLEDATRLQEKAVDLFVPFPILVPGGMQICIKIPSSDATAGWLLSELMREIYTPATQLGEGIGVEDSQGPFGQEDYHLSFKGLCIRSPHPKAGHLLDLGVAVADQVQMGTFLEAVVDLPRDDLRIYNFNQAVDDPEVVNILIVASDENIEELKAAFLSVVFPWNCINIKIITSTGSDDTLLYQKALERLKSSIGPKRKRRTVPFDVVVLDSNVYRTQSVTTTLNDILSSLPPHRVFLVVKSSDIATVNKCNILGLLYVTVPVDVAALELMLHHTFHNLIAKACRNWMGPKRPVKLQGRRRNSSACILGDGPDDSSTEESSLQMRLSAPASSCSRARNGNPDTWRWSGWSSPQCHADGKGMDEKSNHADGDGCSSNSSLLEPSEQWANVDLFTPEKKGSTRFDGDCDNSLSSLGDRRTSYEIEAEKRGTKCCILGNEPFVNKTTTSGEYLMMTMGSCASKGSVHSSPLPDFRDQCDLSCGGAGGTPLVATGTGQFCCMSEGKWENFSSAGVALKM